MAIVVLFPDGHLPGPRYRFPASLIAAFAVAAGLMSSMAGGIEMQPQDDRATRGIAALTQALATSADATVHPTSAWVWLLEAGSA